VTFILNVLHKNLSILAADKRGVAEWPTAFGFPARGKAITHDLTKITLNSTGLLAMGMSGYSEHHAHIGRVSNSVEINEALSIIRHHMEDFLRVDDRALLIKTASPFVNEGVVSFYDKEIQAYFTNEFSFNEFRNSTHLHRATEEVKLFCAGSGRRNFDMDSGRVEIQSLVSASNDQITPDIFIPWMKEMFRRVSAGDEGCGPEALFAVSTRHSHEFCFIERC
jgi:hypothetical protein